MIRYFLAIDIGASGGRHILGHLEDDRLVTEEIFRFDNSPVRDGNSLNWDIDLLFDNILEGMKACARLGKYPEAVGIDTWGVDFVLLDAVGDRICPAVSYRDLRTDGMEAEVEKIIPFNELYRATGIQRQQFNTVYQLMALKQSEPELLKRAEVLLMIPDYLGYRLTGIKAQEYTNATTTGLVNASSKDWDRDIIKRLGFPEKLFGRISTPGTLLGGVTDEIAGLIGYDTQVFMTASHDTASAIVAVPADVGNVLYISSGTWSLMGTELINPICSRTAQSFNLTNEGGYDYRYRFLKNIMGLWMLQRVREELCPGEDYRTIGDAAEHAVIDSIVDVNNACFLSPKSMVSEICDHLRATDQQIPIDIGQFARVIYRSLAKCYRKTLDEIESVTGEHYPVINIVGGGSRSDFLNRQVAIETGRTILTGPTEGTAIGNLMVLLMANGEITSLRQARKIIADSVHMKRYEP